MNNTQKATSNEQNVQPLVNKLLISKVVNKGEYTRETNDFLQTDMEI